MHQLSQRSSYVSTVTEVTVQEVKPYIHRPWGQAVHPLSQRSNQTSTVPGAKLYIQCPRGQAKIYCPWGQAVHPLSQRSNQTSTVPGAKLYIQCPRGQAVHLLSLGPSCTSTVPEVRLYIYCPWGQAVHPLSQRSSCASTVPEVKLCIHSPHPLFPWMAGVQQNWWRLLCSLLSASWLDSRNQTENVTVMHSSPKLKQGCCSPLAANEKNFPVAKVCFVVIVVCFKGLGVSKKKYKKMNICPKKTIQGIHWSGTKNKTISFPTVESTKLIGPTNKQGSQLVPENHHTLRH